MIPGALPCPKCGTAEKLEYVGMWVEGIACTEHDEEAIHAWGYSKSEALAEWNRYAEEHEEETTP